MVQRKAVIVSESTKRSAEQLTKARAILMRVSSSEKAFRMLPGVLSVKTRKPEVDMARQATTLRAVET